MRNAGMTASRRERKAARAKDGPVHCSVCAQRRPGWFCSLSNAAMSELDPSSSSILLPAQTALFHEGDAARCLYFVCRGYLKITAGEPQHRERIVRVAGPGTLLGLYAVLAQGAYEVSASSLTAAQIRPIDRARFLSFLRGHKEMQMFAVQSVCQEYRFVLQDVCRIALADSVAARLARLLLDLAHQIGEDSENNELHFPLLLTHEEMASMACTTRETVTRTLGQFRKDGWISIENSVVTLHSPEQLHTAM